MTGPYSLTFDWPHTDAHSVIVTGTFDNWSSSVHLQKTESGFTGSVAVPWDTKILYKFVVDGNWVTHPNQPTETDGSGFVNNVVHTPSKPATEPEVAATPQEIKKKTVEPGARPVEVAPKVPIPIQPVLDGSTDTTPNSKPAAAETEASTHQPAPEASAAPAPAPSTPPQKKEKLPVAPPAPVTPIKTDGVAAAGHARTSTSGSTAPSSSAPSTPKTQNTFPTSEGDGGSPSSKFSSVGKRQNRQSFFGKLKARLSGSPDKKEKRRFGSEEPRSGSPTPTPKKNSK